MTDFLDLADGGRALIPLVAERVGNQATLILAVVPNGTPAAIEVGRALALPVRAVGVQRDTSGIRRIHLPDLTGMAHVVVIDDAVESGTAAVAIGGAVRTASRARLTLAVPVCPVESLAALLPLFDDVIAAVRPEVRRPLFSHYAHFHTVEVDDALRHLAELAVDQGAPAGQ